MNHSTRVRLRACALLLLTAFAARAQVRDEWERVEQCNPGRDGASGISYIQFFDNKNGVIAGDGGFIRYTHNGGITWRQPTLPPALNSAASPFREDIIAGSRFTGGRRGSAIYLVTEQRLLRSRDRGATWEMTSRPLPPGRLSKVYGPGLSVEYYDVAFAGEKEGWVLCGVLKKVNKEEQFLQSFVLYTDDGGESWDETPVGPPKLVMVRMHFADRERGWVVGERGTILHTEDGGRSWQPQRYSLPESAKGVDPRPKLLDVHFRGKERGLIVGKQGMILKTDDGGEQWFTIIPPDVDGKPERRDLIRVQAADDDRAWIVGQGGVIFNTENGGQRWSRQEGLTDVNLYAIYMQDRKRGWGWAAGDRRTLLRYDADDDYSGDLRDGMNGREEASRPGTASRARHE